MVGGTCVSGHSTANSIPGRGQNQNWLPQPALSGAQTWAEMLHHPSILGGPQTNGDKIRIGGLTLPSGGPTSWRKCYVNPAFSGIPNKGNKSKALKKKTERRKFPTYSLTLPVVKQIHHPGV